MVRLELCGVEASGAVSEEAVVLLSDLISRAREAGKRPLKW